MSNNNYKHVWAAALLLAALFNSPAGRTVPLEVYGRLPAIEDVALSPDGSRMAYIRTSGDVRGLVIISLADKKLLGGLRLGSTKLRGIGWADDDHLMLVTSATASPIGLAGPQFEWRTMQVYDVAKHRAIPVPNPYSAGIRMMNVISGPAMVRHVDGHTILFVTGVYLTDRTLPALFRIDLQTGTQTLVRAGTATTHNWLVDEAGEFSVEEDHDQEKQRWWLFGRRAGRLEEIASGHEGIDYPVMIGYGPQSDTLIMQSIESGEQIWRLLSMKDGTLGQPMAERKTLSGPIEDGVTHRMIGGVVIDDSSLHYVFFDHKTQVDWDSIVRAFNKDRVALVSASQDFKKLVVAVDGAEFGYLYELIDMNTLKGESVGDIYEGVTEPLEVRRITYEAADGLKIPAYLTLPPKKAPKNLPLIVFPHGGPAMADRGGFDWWAQAMADQGYAVLQPNFRGSDLNTTFLAAGYGEFGRKMQTDLSDGVRYLVKEGIADPARVCIVGASYGGYAALAGAALDTGVYRCAVSVAGLSDLKRMLGRGNDESRTQRYWDRYMGITGPDDRKLDEISPIKHIAAVNIPILLIHGKDDTVVGYEQSSAMFDALKRANKDVELVTLKNEDHWLSRSETRLQMLQSSVTFLRAHNPPD
jgi:dipeptidyl aminopeptidase/acylaminoacyl peptidase